jgi:AcrR family transcriptional regulator
MSTHLSATGRNLRHEQVRAQILEAAAASIAENGYHGMSMRGLARATGRALANFYNYFASKEDVLFALQTRAFETLNATAEKAISATDTSAAGLYAFIFNHLRYVAEHKSIMRVLVHEAANLPQARRKAVRRLKERYFQIGQRIVAEAFSQGCGNPDASAGISLDTREIELVTYSLFGMLNWSFGWYEPARHGTPQDVAHTIHRTMLCGIVARCPHRPVQRNTEQRLSAMSHPPLIGHDLV